MAVKRNVVGYSKKLFKKNFKTMNCQCEEDERGNSIDGMNHTRKASQSVTAADVDLAVAIETDGKSGATVTVKHDKASPVNGRMKDADLHFARMLNVGAAEVHHASDVALGAELFNLNLRSLAMPYKTCNDYWVYRRLRNVTPKLQSPWKKTADIVAIRALTEVPAMPQNLATGKATVRRQAGFVCKSMH
jgi:hypothetical protein